MRDIPPTRGVSSRVPSPLVGEDRARGLAPAGAYEAVASEADCVKPRIARRAVGLFRAAARVPSPCPSPTRGEGDSVGLGQGGGAKSRAGNGPRRRRQPHRPLRAGGQAAARHPVRRARPLGEGTRRRPRRLGRGVGSEVAQNVPHAWATRSHWTKVQLRAASPHRTDAIVGSCGS